MENFREDSVEIAIEPSIIAVAGSWMGGGGGEVKARLPRPRTAEEGGSQSSQDLRTQGRGS